MAMSGSRESLSHAALAAFASFLLLLSGEIVHFVFAGLGKGTHARTALTRHFPPPSFRVSSTSLKRRRPRNGEPVARSWQLAARGSPPFDGLPCTRSHALSVTRYVPMCSAYLVHARSILVGVLSVVRVCAR